MPQKKKTTNKKTQQNFFKRLIPTTNRGKVLTFVLIFAFLGGGYFLYKSHAAPIPPTSLTTVKSIPGAISTDGDGSPGVDCISVTGSSGFGPLANCFQYSKPVISQPLKGRIGFYSPITKKFSPQGAWYTGHYISNSSLTAPIACKNMGYVFSGVPQQLDTPYGPVQYGQIYRQVDENVTSWQIKWASRSLINGNCATTGDWMSASQLK